MATPSITVITCYYKVKSKHSFEDYSQWIKNLLLTIQCNIIIFTPAEQAESLTRLAMQNRKHLDVNKNVKIIVKELEELENNKIDPISLDSTFPPSLPPRPANK